jgi:type IV secretory pathway VirB6-like protein
MLITDNSENFYTCFLFTSMLRPTDTLILIFAPAIIILVFFTLGFPYYSSASEDIVTAPTEDVLSEDISALIQSAAQHVNETAKAIESGNSTLALGLLDQIRTDLNNINGNITDLIFSVEETPP